MTEFPQTQTSLLASIKSLDDRRAWEQFVSIYRPVIYRMARKRGFQAADAEDLTQRVLTSIAGSIQRWSKTESQVRFRHWLRRVVKNAIINAATRKRPEVAFSGLSDKELFREPVADDETSRQIESEYRRQLFQRAAAVVRSDVDQLTWRAFELTVIDEMPVEKAAFELNKSVGSVYAARSRIMKRLKSVVQTWEDES